MALPLVTAGFDHDGCDAKEMRDEGNFVAFPASGAVDRGGEGEGGGESGANGELR